MVTSRRAQARADDRSMPFASKSHGRYWWFKELGVNYVPPVFDFLKADEWDVMSAWYDESEELFPHGTGECNIPAVSMLMGIVMGNNISRIVQCGHFIGFSTLLLGFMMRRMGHRKGLFSVDYDATVTNYTAKWLKEAHIEDYVQLVISDSAERALPEQAEIYLGGKPQIVFIDSSHEYEHTRRELELWVPRIQPGGFAILHDVSEFACAFDSKGGGGVRKAVASFDPQGLHQKIMINDFCGSGHFGERTVYKDACGLGIIQVRS